MIRGFFTDYAAKEKAAPHRMPGRFPERRLVRALSLLFQKREAGALVLRDFVTFRKGVDRAFTGLAREVVEGHFLAAAQLLEARVEEIGFAAFFADCAECHGGLFPFLGFGWESRGQMTPAFLRVA
jgi:mono/diheme cytochrome c family protein